jgi:Cdc6-like AAA superfamily ATPase
MDKEKKIERLQAIIDKNADPKIVESAIAQLKMLETEGKVAIHNQAAGVTQDPDAQAILDALNKAISKGFTSGVDVRKEIEEVLKARKINETDLSDSLRALIQSSRKIELTITQLNAQPKVTSTTDAFLQKPLTQMLLSDMRARNNSYLYGAAGTGKTYMAEEIANLLGWTLITVNCSQYTSPLDILGGQTIEGYQEGRVSMAWENVIYESDGSSRKIDGVVLLLDELPKIDPNTAGIMNDALAKVKNFKEVPATGALIRPTIRNGKGVELSLQNLFVIATGNVPLNTIDPDYEANFKQDLSLQDRFVGSTYKIGYDYQFEFNNIMSGYAFIWIFLIKVREAIVELRAQSQAFVSMRIMINAKETYRTYRDVLDEIKTGKANLISSPKTLIDTMDEFFNLFKPAQKESIIDMVGYEEFKRIVAEKNKMPYVHSSNKVANDFNTPAEIAEAQILIEKYKQSQSN